MADSTVNVPAPPASAAEGTFEVERRGIDFVPPEERTARPRDLFWIWVSTCANVLVLISGALMVAVGLGFWQAVALILVGNLTVVAIGLASLPGPRAGSAALTITRAPFGRNGNRLPALLMWIGLVGYEASDLVVIVLAALVLLGKLGIHETTLVRCLTIVAAIAIQLPLPIYGYQAILRVFRWLAGAFVVFSLLMAALLAPKVHPSAVHAASGLVPWTLAVAILLSTGGLGWPNASDYTRYLPRATSRRSIVGAVGLGAYASTVGMQLIGAALATVVPGTSDVVHGLPHAFPDWFVVPYLLFAILALYAVNTIDLYSSGLTLQALGAPLPRVAATCVDLVICVPIVFVVVFSADFSRYYDDFLLLLIVINAPLVAVIVVDCLLRRGTYDPVALLRGDGGVYRYARGIGARGLAALLAGMAVATLCVHTPDYVGPLSHVLGGADVSALAGALVAGGAYALLGWRRTRAEAAATRAAGRDGIAPLAEELAIEHVTA